MKGSALCSSFSTGKFALRSLSQSLAREFGPKGVHVSHVNVDGVIDIPKTKEWLTDAGPDAKIKPEAVSRPCFRYSRYGRMMLTGNGGTDCRRVLVPAYAAAIMLHARDRRM